MVNKEIIKEATRLLKEEFGELNDTQIKEGLKQLLNLKPIK